MNIELRDTVEAQDQIAEMIGPEATREHASRLISALRERGYSGTDSVPDTVWQSLAAAAQEESRMNTRFNWKVTAKCSKTERDARFLALSLQMAEDAKARFEMAAEMHWLFTNRRDADKFARKARRAPNGFESVEVARNV